jgi:hypothetical protein
MLNCFLRKITSIITHSFPFSVYLMLLVVPRTDRRMHLYFKLRDRIPQLPLFAIPTSKGSAMVGRMEHDYKQRFSDTVL